MPLLAFAAFALLSPPQSGEAVLRSVFEHYGKMRKFEAGISKAARDRRGETMGPTISLLLSYDSKQRFRVEQSEYWGGGNTFTSDGKTLRVVSADGGPTTLRNAGPSLMQSHPMLAPRGGAFAVLFLLLEGPSAYDKLVAPDGSVKLNGRRIDFKSKDYGSMSMTLDGKLITDIQFDNKPNRDANYRFLPMFSEKPEDPMEVEVITYEFVNRFARNRFDTSVTKGEFVVDERKKPPVK
jgi:hypothetical protein